MSTATRLNALLATMGRINPALFGGVKRSAAEPVGRLLGAVDEPVLRAGAALAPELTAGVAGVQYLVCAAVQAGHSGADWLAELASGIREWCTGPGAICSGGRVPWPSRVPLPEWAGRSTGDPWRVPDMFFSAAAALAGVAATVPDEGSRAHVYQLSEELLARAELAEVA